MTFIADQVEKDFDVLPVNEFKSLIIQAIVDSQIFICISETGSGKTTQIPQFCLDMKLLGDNGMIGITQPRRVAAITVAQRVCEERNSRIGDTVGYTVRFDDQSSSRTRIKYMTDGILLRECLADPDLSKYQIIMLDEAHERSINTDILFSLVKAASKRRKELRVIVTSATLDVDKFSSYFNSCPVIRIPGRVYPVDIYHSKTRQVMTPSGPASSNYVTGAVEAVLNIHRQDEEGHILVFLTGQEEVERACALIREEWRQHKAIRDENEGNGNGSGVNSSADRELVVLPLYAALPTEAQKLVFQKLEPPTNTTNKPLLPMTSCKLPRKCIVATNIAETSITVPHVRFVVDSGYTKQKTFDPARSMESLVVVPISQVSSDQRAGRAGRTAVGSCYRLYSSECYDNMMPETVPEILRSNLANTVLYLKALGIVDCLCFDFIEPPAPDQVMEALVQLHMLGAIDAHGLITETGRVMSRLPLEPLVARMVVSASRPECDCLDAAVSIAAMLSAENVFVRPLKPQNNMSTNNSSGSSGSGSGGGMASMDSRAESAHSKLCHPLGDHLTYLHIYRLFEQAGSSSNKSNRNDSNNSSRSTHGSSYNNNSNNNSNSYNDQEEQKIWCRENFINLRSMKNAVRIRSQLWSEVKDLRCTDTDTVTAGIRHNKDNHAARKLSEDVRVCHAVASSLFMKAAKLCAGNDVIYRSLPLTVTGQQRGSGSDRRSSGSSDSSETDWSRVTTFMTAEVMLLHPQAGSAVSLSTHRAPEYVVFQDLVFGGRASMRHVCAVDFSALTALRLAYTPTSPLALSGRVALAVAAAGESQRKTEVSSNSNSSSNISSSVSGGASLGMKRKLVEASVSGNGGSHTADNVSGKPSTSSAATTSSYGNTTNSSADEPSSIAQSATSAAGAAAGASTASNAAAEAARQRFLARKGRAT